MLVYAMGMPSIARRGAGATPWLGAGRACTSAWRSCLRAARQRFRRHEACATMAECAPAPIFPNMTQVTRCPPAWEAWRAQALQNHSFWLVAATAVAATSQKGSFRGQLCRPQTPTAVLRLWRFAPQSQHHFAEGKNAHRVRRTTDRIYGFKKSSITGTTTSGFTTGSSSVSVLALVAAMLHSSWRPGSSSRISLASFSSWA